MAHLPMVRTALLLAVLASPAVAAPAVVLFPAVGQTGEVTVMGRVLKEAPTGGTSPLSRNLRRLTAAYWEDVPVVLSFVGQVEKVRTDDDGVFEATFKAPAGKKFSAGLHQVTASVKGASAKATVKVIHDATPFFVISDFDDTVAITNVVSRGKFIDAALLQDSDTQPVVKGMSRFYQCLVEQKTPESGLAFVSGSPHQYAGRIAKFLVRNQFPFSGLYLRNLGVNTLSGYKQPTIRKLIKRMKHDVILIGDSGEQDPEVYAEIKRDFPDRVRAIYIRDAGRAEDPERFNGMVLFQDAREPAKDAVEKGFMSKACYDQAFGEERAR